jgi:hypothetical protein
LKAVRWAEIVDIELASGQQDGGGEQEQRAHKKSP